MITTSLLIETQIEDVQQCILYTIHSSYLSNTCALNIVFV